jgi:tRNA pseudouridine55 synthase
VSRRGGGEGPTGLVVVDKEAGWTSHDVVAKLRRIFGQRRTGHAGTLDPPATGVLLVGLGRATRLLRYLQDTTKVYDGVFELGSTTSTLDAEGERTASFDMSGVQAEEVSAAAGTLTGDILQVPPMVSALKVGGRRLHELAREGIEVERAPRPVRIDRFEVEPEGGDPLRFRFEVVCSSGTYIRSLVDDLGRALGGGAHLVSLRRTAVGSFTLDEARRLEELEAAAEQLGTGEGGILLSPAEALRGLEQLVVDEEAVSLISRGMALERSSVGAIGGGPFALLDAQGELLAVYEGTEGDRIKAAVVLAAR